MDANVIDVTDATFEQAVIQGSKQRPVVVDFWAAWCAPCRSLGPVLERLAEERSGAFLLGKLDVDSNPVVSQRYQVMSIPEVKAFVDGEPVDAFTGALPEPQVRAWIDALVPTEADRAAAEAAGLEAAGNIDAAEARYEEALAADPAHVAARLGMARIMAARGDYEQAEELVTPLLPDPEASAVLARVRVAGWSAGDGTEPLARARALAVEGDWRGSLEEMLRLVPDDPEARGAILDVFAVLGDEDPLTREFRPKLAAALF